MLRSIGSKRHGKSTSPRVHSSLVVFSFDGARNRTWRMNEIQSVCEDREVYVRDNSSFLFFCVYCYVDMWYFLNPSKNWMALVSAVGVRTIFKLFTLLICTCFFLFCWCFCAVLFSKAQVHSSLYPLHGQSHLICEAIGMLCTCVQQFRALECFMATARL